MNSENIKRFENFSIDAYLKNVDYKLPENILKNSDLLLVPYGAPEENRYPAFMMGTYNLSKSFKSDFPQFNIQPEYSDDITIPSIVFNDINLYVGSFILNSIVAPFFVNWLYDKWKKNFKDDDKIKINIEINIHDKEDNFSTSFKFNDSAEIFKSDYIPTIEEYTHLKKGGRIKQFDNKYVGEVIDYKA